MSFDWTQLQNGSDIRGISHDGIEGEQVNLDKEKTEILGRSFFTWCLNKFNSPVTIAVGMDSRITGPSLKQAFFHGIIEQGGNVLDCGMASTPAMFMITKHSGHNANAGVMLTASHLPYNRNGLKFFTASGGLNKHDIQEILAIAANGIYRESGSNGSIISVDYISEYAELIVDKIRKAVNDQNDYMQPLKGMHILVDAGNGAGGFFADRILQPLGANTEGSQYLDPDGMFPNHIPNPENQSAMESISNAVITKKADLGIIFDTDVDRAAIVDKNGNPINRNSLIALIAAIILEEHPGSTIVTDSITSEGLKTFIEENLNGRHHRFKRGYKNVINEAIRLNEQGIESWIAIETSGHAAMKENYFLDDGAYLIAKVLIKAAQLKQEGKHIGSLIHKLAQPVESQEYRYPISEDDFISYGNKVIEGLKQLVEELPGWQSEKENYEGIRVRCTAENEKGWFLLRLSLHDPVMPLNVESDVQGGIKNIMGKLEKLLKTYPGLKVQ